MYVSFFNSIKDRYVASLHISPPVFISHKLISSGEFWRQIKGTPTQYVKTKYIGDKVYRTKYISNEGSWRLRTSTTLCTRNKTSSEHSTGLTMYVSDKVYNKQTKLATNWTINIFLNFISNYYKKIYFRNSYES